MRGKRSGESHFRWRGTEVSRIEGLSDCVFAFALTLLVVSLEVPRTYGELVHTLRGFPSFAACFALLGLVWHSHYRFFRRYGLEDLTTIALNALLLFLVLFYVYPLKFLFGYLFDMAFGWAEALPGPGGELARAPAAPMGFTEMRSLMLFYGAGFALVFAIFAWMHQHAWRQREELALDPPERVLTKAAVHSHLLSAGVGIGSMALVLSWPRHPEVSGLFYCIMGPLHGAHGWLTGRALRRVSPHAD